ncbi:hypothetical protein ACWKYD_11755 [Enterobacter cloacae]
MKISPTSLAVMLFSACAMFSSQLYAEHKFGFATTRCALPDAPFPISFEIDDYVHDFLGIAYNIIYIPEDESNRSDMYSLYINSDGYDYFSQQQDTTGIAPVVGVRSNNAEGAMTSYISKPVCTTKNDCQPYPESWSPTVNFGLSAYDNIKTYYPNDLIIVHSGVFPSLSDDTLRTTIFTSTRRFKLLRIELFAVTKWGDADVNDQWMHDTGAEPIVLEYRNSSVDKTNYFLDDKSRIARPLANSALTTFPTRLDRSSIQSMDFRVKYAGGKLGEIYGGAKFYYFTDDQKALLTKCQQ